MDNKKITANYTPLAKWLHWLVAALILTQYLLIELAERAEHTDQIVKQLGIVANHKSIGITILFLAVVRILFRWRHPAPALPSTMPGWQIKASHISHALLYVFLFALPITGWLMSSASAYTVSWFNLFPLPDLIVADKHNAEWLELVHERLADALIILAALHIAAAIKHHVLDKDTILVRMLSTGSVVAFFVVSAAMVIGFGGFKSTNSADNDTTQVNAPTASASELSKSTLPIWQIDYSNSHIKFTGEQAGAPFTGEWQQWQGTLQFDAEQLSESRFDVSININSVESNDDERDDTILSADFFDVVQFPEARFQAQTFSQGETSSEFIANGQLTMKGISQPTDLSFSITQNGDQITLTGQAKLERHAWNIGTGDWADPTWVGSDVTVKVLVNAAITR